MSLSRTLAFLLFSTIAACGGDGSPTTPSIVSSTHMSSTATTYLNAALKIMQSNSYYRSKLDWNSIRTSVFAVADGAHAQTTAATYPAIRAGLALLGDHHSFLVPPTTQASVGEMSMSGNRVESATAFSHPADSLDAELIGGRYGYVRVPTFSLPPSSGTGPVTAFADTLQALVRVVDASNPCGWVVDLRHNNGGNMWPMLVGIGPIVGEGTNLGGFLNDVGDKNIWFYEAGTAGYTISGKAPVAARIDRTPYTLRRPDPPVAVLTDQGTASSGEAIAIAFRGRANTRSFGVATYGLPTANSSYALSDGAYILLMTALDLDRNGNQYIDPIPPDETIQTTAAPATDDAVVNAATLWLSKQARCTI